MLLPKAAVQLMPGKGPPIAEDRNDPVDAGVDLGLGQEGQRLAGLQRLADGFRVKALEPARRDERLGTFIDRGVVKQARNLMGELSASIPSIPFTTMASGLSPISGTSRISAPGWKATGS
jgi:hypothetical protein